MRSHSGSGRRTIVSLPGSAKATTWPGTPTTVAFGGTFVTTTEPAPMRAFSPIVTSPMTFAPAPTTTFVAERRVALGAPRARAAERHALGQVAVVADDRRLADDDAHAVVDEEPLADLRAGVDLDAGEAPAEVRDQARGSRAAAVWSACARRWSCRAWKPG